MATQERTHKLKTYAEQRKARGIYDKAVYDNDSRFVIARSLANAHHNVETLQLYAKSIVRMLEACHAEAGALRELASIASTRRPGKACNTVDLQFVRTDIDRLVAETQAQLAVVNHELAITG
ncbi:MAG: hypothetical protein KKE76_12340 [Gammaproteobacteria bacterium]|nr:hypothetical protein [Gammaproteobacteria bacterium]